MQNTNDQDETPTDEVATSASDKPDQPTRRSSLRSRSARKSGQSSNATTTESIGEIQPTLGETLEDDLTLKSKAAKAKGSDRGGDNREDRGAPNEGREQRRPRQSNRGRHGPAKHHSRESDGKSTRQEHGEAEGKNERRARGERRRSRQRSRRGKGDKEKSSGQRQESGSGHSQRSKSKSSSDNKPATYNPSESQEEVGFFGKAGKLLSSLFGGSKEKPKEEPRRHKGSSQKQGSKRRRRRRRRSRGDRGGRSSN